MIPELPQPFNYVFSLIGLFFIVGLLISLSLDPKVKCWLERKLGKDEC